MDRRTSGAILTALLVTLVSVAPATAIPADPEQSLVLSQPDGHRFQARLDGDEWAHWYETADHHTILQQPDGLWVYAVRGSRGTLVPGTTAVGAGAPAVEEHLRPARELLRPLLERRAGALPQPTRASITGVANIAVILIEFADTPGGEGSGGPHDPPYFTGPGGIITGASSGTVADYYDEVSYGQLEVQATVAGSTWYASTQDETYYGADCDTLGACTGTVIDNCNTCIWQLVREAVLLADAAGFDFSLYDGDGDGVIDHLMIVHAGADQGASGAPDDIWSHRGVVPGDSLVVDGKAIEGYVLVAEHDAMSVLAHEFAHDLGAPDLYDWDGDGNPVGDWCLMSTAVKNDHPPHICGFLKHDLDGDFSNGVAGWAIAGQLDATGTYAAGQLATEQVNSVYVTTPAFDGEEYFVVENRQPAGYYESSLPGAGLIFTHVDLDMPPNPNGGFNDGPPYNPYYRVWIERPEGEADPDLAGYSQDSLRTRFDPETAPNTNSNGDIGTNLFFRRIGALGSSMSFDFRTEPYPLAGTIDTDSTLTVENSPYVVTSDLTVADGVTLTIEPGVVVKFNSHQGMTVYGQLSAVGAPADSIVFTSYRDDSHGGDTNGDGPSEGARSDWIGVNFPSPDAGTRLDYCNVLFGGYSYPWGTYGLYLSGSGSELDITHSTVANNYCGLYAESGTSCRIEDCLVADNRYYGVKGQSCGELRLLRTQVLGHAYEGVTAAGCNVLVVRDCVASNSRKGLYIAAGASTVVINNTCTGNASSGIQIYEGATTVDSLVANVVQGNGDHGIYCTPEAQVFSGNQSADNGAYGYCVDAEMVRSVLDPLAQNTRSNNGHLGAIGIATGTVTTGTTWTSEQVYVVAGSFNLGDQTSLFLSPGTIVKFNSGQSMNVYGQLSAVGAPADSITFTSYRDDSHGGDTNGDGPSEGARSDWSQVSFSSPDAGTRLDYCNVLFGGYSHYYGTYGLYLSGGGSELDITHSTVANNYCGLYAESGTSCRIEDCLVADNTYYGVNGQSCGELRLLRTQVLGHAYEGVTAAGCNVLVVRDCVASNSRKGLYIAAGASTVVINNTCTGNASSGIQIYEGATTVDSLVANVVQGNGGHGIYCNPEAQVFSGNQSADNGGYGYCVDAEMVRSVLDPLAQNTRSNNGRLGAIGIMTGTVTTGTTWTSEQAYVVESSFNLGDQTSLFLSPGTIVKFNSGQAMNVYGQLSAVGAPADSITFTSYRDDLHGGDTNGDGSSSGQPGDWYRINFSSPDAGTQIDYCNVLFGGYNTYVIAVAGSGSGIDVTHSTVAHNREGLSVGLESTIADCRIFDHTNGRAIYATAPLHLLDTEISNSQGDCGVYLTSASEATELRGNTISRNHGTYGGLYLPADVAGQIDSTNVLVDNGNGNSISISGGNITRSAEWGNQYTYLLWNNVALNDGVTFMLPPGAVLKFRGAYQLTVQGTLVAAGTSSEKIIMTSWKDDAYGGDTNANGSNNQGQPGDWKCLDLNGADLGTTLSWLVVSYAGYNGYANVWINGCDLTMENCIVHHARDYGIYVKSNATLAITHSDIYDNGYDGLDPTHGYGLYNANLGLDVDASGCWWGDATGPYNATANPTGLGNQVSDRVVFDNPLSWSIDNPWETFPSPVTSGTYYDVVVLNVDNDPQGFRDIVASTPEDGIRCFLRSDMGTWYESAPVTQFGYWARLDSTDFDENGWADIVAAGNDSIGCFAADGAGGFVAMPTPYAGTSNDVVASLIDGDGHVDLAVATAGAGVLVYLGDGAGGWSNGTHPTAQGAYNRVACGDVNNDSFNDIVATSADNRGVRIWINNGDGTWSPGGVIGDGHAYYGLALGDIDKDGFTDLAFGTPEEQSIYVYRNAGGAGWAPSTGPAASAPFLDLAFAYLSADSLLDLAGSTQGGGVQVWTGTSRLDWSYWYHPTLSGIFRGFALEDLTLEGSRDLVACSDLDGIAIWQNRTPPPIEHYFTLNPASLGFGDVVVGATAQDDFTLCNTSADTLHQIIVYATNPVLELDLVAGDFTPPAETPRAHPLRGTMSVGPFDLPPGGCQDVRVYFTPAAVECYNEVVIVHSSLEIRTLAVAGCGVDSCYAQWSVDLDVANATGGPGNSSTLTCGGGIGATGDLDPCFGEMELPPPPLPDVFDARFVIPGTNGAQVDIHDYYNETDSFDLTWQAGSGGNPVTLSWDPSTLPEGTFFIAVGPDTLNMADTTQVVTSFETATILTARQSSFTYALNAGWYLLSRAVDTGQSALPDLFPGAVSAWTWSPDVNNYVQASDLGVGIGYWIDMGIDTLITHIGDRVRTVQRTLPAGWSMVGTVFDSVAIGDIGQVPPDCIVSIFGYDAGYYTPDVLLPGQGFWFHVSEDCEVTIPAGSGLRAGEGGRRGSGSATATAAPATGAQSAAAPAADAGKPFRNGWRVALAVQNGGGRADRRQLAFGCARGASAGVDPALGERSLPPWPPSLVFESRLMSAGGDGLYLDLRDTEEGGQRFEVAWQAGSGGYPLTLSWDGEDIPDGVDLTIRDNLDGSVIPPVDMRSTSHIVISEEQAFLTGVVIEATWGAAAAAAAPPVRQFALARNVPNPVLGTTTITYALPHETPVRLEIYDVTGRVVRRLASGRQPAGIYGVVWDGRNDDGARVASGVYFYRLDADEFTKSMKLLVVR